MQKLNPDALPCSPDGDVAALGEVVRELQTIAATGDFTRRFAQAETGPAATLSGPLNRVLDAMEARERELQARLAELMDARDNAQTVSALLKRVKDDLKSRSKQLDMALNRVEASSNAKSQFLANMSHEIRTPLNGILGMAELLARSDLMPKQAKQVATIVQSGRALLTIINDILDFSKIEAGRIDITALPFDLRLCVDDVIAILLPGADGKRIGLSVDWQSDLPRFYVGDVGRFRQILMNVIGNAIKFTDHGGVRVSVAGSVSGETADLEISILDSGCGIPEEKIGKLFEKFFQVDNSMTRRYEGTGLGLAICKLLVEKMGGKISAESEVGVGSVFRLKLPLPLYRPERVAPAAAIDWSQKRLLVVTVAQNDDEEHATAAWDLPCRVDIVVVEEVGRIELASEAGPAYDAILVDTYPISEPALAVVHDLRARLGGTPVPILVRTPIGMPGDGKLFAAAGVRGYLANVKDHGLIARAVETVLQDAMRGEQRLVTRHTLAESACAIGGPESTGDGEPGAMIPASRRVLLVEDSLVNQEVARDFLLELGCTVSVAKNGKEAVGATEGEAFDAVLMDCQMPEMDGFEATRLIRAREKRTNGRRVAIIALTANAFASDRTKCLESGMDDFLTKPFVPEEFERVLNKWLASANAESRRAATASLPQATAA